MTPASPHSARNQHLLNIGFHVQTACFWEATARKPGNVDPSHDFADLTYVDLLLSGAAIAPVLHEAWRHPVGKTVLEAVQATRRVVQTNTNLGIVLLLTPLAAVQPGENLREGVARVLAELDEKDSRLVYQAIRLAMPGGLGRVNEQDVAAEPDQPLVQIMRLAAERDMIARQYATDFGDIFDEGLPALAGRLERAATLEEAIVGCYLHLLSRFPDSLFARKRGADEAAEASRRAGRVLDLGWPGADAGRQAAAELDAWLRAEGHGRNPGTTADLVTACLFAALREGTIQVPSRLPWSAGAGEHG